MFTRKDIDFLRNFRSSAHPVISLYLNTDGKIFSKKEVDTRFKEMIRLVRMRLDGNANKDYRKLILSEIQKVEDHILKNYKEFNIRGMALFICSDEDLWYEIELPRSPRNRLIIDDAPLIRPLQFQEVEYQRFCTALVDKQTARIYLIYQGTILEYKMISDDVPARVKWGGWAGYDEKRSTRKVSQKINEHFNHVAETLFDLFKRDHFEWLIVGCKTGYLKEFESTLHSYLRERIAGHLEVSVDLPEHEALAKSMKVEQNVAFKEHCRLVARLDETYRSGGLGVIGLKDVLRHLNTGALDTMVVSRDFSLPGVLCTRCDFLGIEKSSCPLCGSEGIATNDVVTNAIDRALDMNCNVKQLFEGVGMEKLENIGGFIRYRL